MEEHYVHHRIFEISQSVTQQIIEWVTNKGWKSLIVYEDTSKDGTKTRPHLHLSILTKTFSHAHYMKMFRKQFSEIKGQKMHGGHDIKDPYSNDKYVCKGRSQEEMPIILYNNGYPESYIEECHINFWTQYNNKLDNVVRDNEERNKKSVVIEVPQKLTWMQKIPVICIQEYPGWEWDASIESKARIYRIVMQKLGAVTKKISPKIVREICDGVQNTLAPKDTENEFWRLVYRDEYHQISPGFFRDF